MSPLAKQVLSSNSAPSPVPAKSASGTPKKGKKERRGRAQTEMVPPVAAEPPRKTADDFSRELVSVAYGVCFCCLMRNALYSLTSLLRRYNNSSSSNSRLLRRLIMIRLVLARIAMAMPPTTSRPQRRLSCSRRARRRTLWRLATIHLRAALTMRRRRQPPLLASLCLTLRRQQPVRLLRQRLQRRQKKIRFLLRSECRRTKQRRRKRRQRRRRPCSIRLPLVVVTAID